jgi:DNA helicase II / ATP-dependent DNA helicase PcrA
MTEFNPTDEQQAIILHDPSQPARILAGPGTGKSSTLVALINQIFERTPNQRIRLLTFTRAATAELAQKVSTHSVSITLRPGTVHSFAVSVLLLNSRAGNLVEPLRIADDWETKEIIEPTLSRKSKVSIPKLHRLILEMAANWESLRPEKDPEVNPEERNRFLGAWNEHRRIYGYTLLAELPYALRNALHNHPDLEGLNFNVIIVDEYQDLNACELEILKLIAQRGCSIIASGDDDQSIYSFRKADPEGIRRFLNDYPNARDFPLSVTQRCGKSIIEWASYVIESDPNRPPGRLIPKSAKRLPEGKVALLSFRGHRAEAKGIAKLTQILIERESISPSEILILLRSDYNKSFSNPIKNELNKLNIPYLDPNIITHILTEPDNRRILAIFRLLVNRTDSIAWATLLKLTSGIGNTFVHSIYNLACTKSYQFGNALLDAYQRGFKDIAPQTANRAHNLMRSVLHWLDSHSIPNEYNGEWGQWIIDKMSDGYFNPPTEDLKKLLLELDQYSESEINFDKYIGQIDPLCKDIASTHSEGVRIMTLTGAKGLSVRATIIGAVEEGIVPRPNSDLSEERRLLYVGMTRAKEFLYCTWARRRRGPTARAGSPNVWQRRSHSSFLLDGPLESQDGSRYIDNYS